MGHQVSFFVMPADLPDLETAMRATGDVCFIVQRKDIASVSTRFIKTQGYWLIEGTESPVIEFSPGLFSGTRLTRGRAYFASDLRFRSELPGPEFVRWGDRVLGRIKKKLTRHPEFAPPWMYFGAVALEWVENNGATMTGGAISLVISGSD